MDIKWHGHSCFTIKGQDATVVADPYDELGSKLPKFKADIVTLGDELAEGKGSVAEVEGEPKILDWPGEFEISNVAIEAFSADRFTKEGESNGTESGAGNVNIFLFAVDGIKVCHLSGLAHELSDELLDRIGDVDVLLLPVGGGDVLDGKTAQKVMEAIEPRVVIPMYFTTGESKLNINGAGDFLKAVGKTELAAQEKYSVSSKASLLEGTMEFVLLEAVS
jgi:L-ascorbate metabolism protein UlaG (beta-lactamase superfamily)